MLKATIAFVLLIVVGLLIWRSPGCRQRVSDIYERHGGWTEEARRVDPVGFIEYAERALRADLEALTRTRRDLAAARQAISEELEKNRALLDSAEELAQDFRLAYRAAEAEGSWPTTVRGAHYTRQELIEQVRLILTQREDYSAIIGQLQETSTLAEAKEEQLVSQISLTKAGLATLPSKREIARVNQLTDRTEDLLEQVDDLIGENEQVLSSAPVRTVEELTARPEPASKEAAVDVQAFLEGAR